MPLITLRQLLDEAQKRQAAIPAFNVNNLEQVQAILEAAGKTNSPVILQASLGARKYAGMTFLKHMLHAALESYPHLPICLHQDHGHTPQVCYEALAAGFSSVMMDGSLEADGKTPSSFESNKTRTQSVVTVAHSLGVSVEGELGCLGALETGEAGEEDGSGAGRILSHCEMLTDVQQACDFLQVAHVDALAIAIGTSHGAAKFKTTPSAENFALYRLKELHEKLPEQHFVLHGASSVPHDLIEKINLYGGGLPLSYGVPIALLQQSIAYGVRKINIDTDLRLAFTAALRETFHNNTSEFDPRKYLEKSKKAMVEICCERFIAFGASGWANEIKVATLEEMKSYYV